jgi:hypothetical protein
MWPLLAPLIDEMASAVIGRRFLWRRPRHALAGLLAESPLFDGDLESFYAAPQAALAADWPNMGHDPGDGIAVTDLNFLSPIVSGLAESDRVTCDAGRGLRRG